MSIYFWLKLDTHSHPSMKELNQALFLSIFLIVVGEKPLKLMQENIDSIMYYIKQPIRMKDHLGQINNRLQA